jgi:hypothetical protein
MNTLSNAVERSFVFESFVIGSVPRAFQLEFQLEFATISYSSGNAQPEVMKARLPVLQSQQHKSGGFQVPSKEENELLSSIPDLSPRY